MKLLIKLEAYNTVETWVYTILWGKEDPTRIMILTSLKIDNYTKLLYSAKIYGFIYLFFEDKHGLNNYVKKRIG